MSTRGVFNGSSISVVTHLLPTKLTSAPDNPNDFLLFFQHFAGDIRWIQYEYAQRAWQGGSINDVVANDAKNGTPISAVKRDFADVHQTHVFCWSP